MSDIYQNPSEQETQQLPAAPRQQAFIAPSPSFPAGGASSGPNVPVAAGGGGGGAFIALETGTSSVKITAMPGGVNPSGPELIAMVQAGLNIGLTVLKLLNTELTSGVINLGAEIGTVTLSSGTGSVITSLNLTPSGTATVHAPLHGTVNVNGGTGGVIITTPNFAEVATSATSKISLKAGNNSTDVGGQIAITAGNGNASPGGQGGDVFIEAGIGAQGGELAISSGNGQAGAGGQLRLVSGTAQSGNHNGGDIRIVPGLQSGTGVIGGIFVENNAGVVIIPTADPHVQGQIFANGAPTGGTPRTLSISGG